MNFNTKIIIVFSVCLFILGDCLEEIPKKDNHILEAEAVIRNTINKIFLTLNLRKLHERPRLQEYATLHKYFVSVSLKDDHNLKNILELTKVNSQHAKSYNNETDFIAILNEIVSEDKINGAEFPDVDVISYIESFTARLKKLRELYAVNTVYVNINTNVLEHLKNIQYLNNTFKDNQSATENDVITSDNEFWEPSGRRIYKGERTKIKYFPFMASIHIFNNFHCSGSIIKSDLIITASSCLQLAWNNRFFRENPAFLSVRVGSSFYGGGGEVIPVLEVYFHPAYDPKTLRNNLCILRLSRRLKFRRQSKRVKRIDIDRSPWNLPLTTAGITILGWGAKGPSGIIFDPWKNILSFSILDIYPVRDCQDVYTKQYVTQKHFCAGFLSKGGGACNRDVGGPGVVDGKLMGVVSFGSPTCGTPDAPTVFTKLGYYAAWIEDVMNKPVPVSLKRTTLKEEFNIFTALMSTDRPTTTTFKIPPLIGKKLDAMSILDIDKALRLLDDNVFKEFLSTMFTSSEIEKYHNLIRNEQAKVANEKVGLDKHEKDKDSSESKSAESNIEFVTKIPMNDETEVYTEGKKSESSESNNGHKTDESKESYQEEELQDNFHKELSQEAFKKVEFVKKNNKKDLEIENDIIKFMKNIDLKKIIQEEVKDTSPVKLDNKSNNESTVTVLYISDVDKAADAENIDEDGAHGGLSIVPDTKFEDMTRSKAKSKLNKLPENEIYGLLSDVVEKEVQKNIFDTF